MALTASQVYKAASLDPSQFDEDIVDKDLSDADQRAALISYIDSDVLPGARAEVAVPFREATGYSTVAAFIQGQYPDLSDDDSSALIAEGEALFDAAVKSYSRSELNKVVDTSGEPYDRDSDQDRIQGNQRRDSLVKWATAVKSGTDGGSSGSLSDVPTSTSATANAVWY